MQFELKEIEQRLLRPWGAYFSVYVLIVAAFLSYFSGFVSALVVAAILAATAFTGYSMTIKAITVLRKKVEEREISVRDMIEKEFRESYRITTENTRMLPVLIKQLEEVIKETEDAAMGIMERFQDIATRAQGQAEVALTEVTGSRSNVSDSGLVRGLRRYLGQQGLPWKAWRRGW